MITMNQTEYENAHNYDLGELWSIFNDLPRDTSLLDVGCGTGRILKFISAHFPGKFTLTGIEKNVDLVAHSSFSGEDKDIMIIPTNFTEYKLGLPEYSPYDYLLFISSIHQMLNTNFVIDKISELAMEGVIIKTVDTSIIHESTISALFPYLVELHFPIHDKIMAPLRSKGFVLTLDKTVKYRILTGTQYYANLCRSRFISSLHKLTDIEIEDGIRRIPESTFTRTEVMRYLVYKREDGKRKAIH
jgi:hypothetical protein